MAAKVGRQTKLTPQLQARIVEVLAAGNYIVAACDYVGIDEDTYYEWVKRGKRGNKADREAGYSEFSEAVKRAQAQAEILSVARIRLRGQNGEWQADAWYLERSHPNRWGKRVNEISGPDGGPIEVVVKGYAKVTPDEWDKDEDSSDSDL